MPDIPDGSEFEFEYALRLLVAGFVTRIRPFGISHEGDLSAYVLNDARRATEDEDLLKWIIHYCSTNPERSIELFDHLDSSRLTEQDLYDALFALSTAQWYVDRPKGLETLKEMWKRFGSSGLLFNVDMAGHLQCFGQSWANLSEGTLENEKGGTIVSARTIADGLERVPDTPRTPCLASDGEISLVFTSRRPEGFEQALRSVLTFCNDIDLVSQWICICEGHSHDQLAELQALYTWIEFVTKSDDGNGSFGDLTAARDRVDSPLVFLFDDENELFVRSNFITRSRKGLEFGEHFGQCLLNLNYARGLDERELEGGMPFRVEGDSYVAHLYDPEREVVKGRSNCHWSHFSLRPGLLRAEVLNLPIENVPFFEHRFASHYQAEGWQTIFLPDIHHRLID